MTVFFVFSMLQKRYFCYMIAKSVILSSAYIPPVDYMTWIYGAERIILEKHENYIKQTYRNRCYIYSANGKLALTIPVIKTQGNHTPIDNIVIDYSEQWQKNHMRAIESAYNSSPFFWTDTSSHILATRVVLPG